ncbi:MAG TPA: TauD/TfdA family dioxygenase [Edaphobacter sp.]|nr:TauD/TfdA family dioxygenase [Edaphobacter sp.]
MNKAAPHFNSEIRSKKRQEIVVSTDDLVIMRFFPSGNTLPLIMEPRSGSVDLSEWLKIHRERVEHELWKYGGILFRNFGIDTVQKLELFANAFGSDLLEYKERSSPRTAVSGKIYTSTDYPPEEPIFLHNENSYQRHWPLKIFFCCIHPASEGGETPVADIRKVFARIDSNTVDKFRKKKVMYTRNFGNKLGLSWEEVFQTNDRTAVEKHCSGEGIKVEWLPENRLRTTAIREAFRNHPKTGACLWFNHATFFHVTSREPKVRDALLQLFTENDLPTNSCYGDGSPIEPEVLEKLREAYNQEAIRFSWERGDVLLLDNMLTAHGRSPFTGERKILVGMAEIVESPVPVDLR